jgi:hypothetical protein
VTVDEWPRRLGEAASSQHREGDEQDAAAGHERETSAPPSSEFAHTDEA